MFIPNYITQYPYWQKIFSYYFLIYITYQFFINQIYIYIYIYPAIQGPANNDAQVGQNVPVKPPQQLAPAQPVPAGPVVPAPQVFYQNWIGKKPEFSGKPEEDAESHLLSTGDWMEAHNFPDEVKVRHFCF